MRPPTRRLVTEHDTSGSAIFRSDDVLPVNRISDTNFAAALLWTTESVPADNMNDVLGETRDVGITLKGGTAFWTTDFGPGAETKFHRTHSIDYAVIISGTIQLELDGSQTRDLVAGDVVVQRGTNHLWRNVSDDWCRVNFILIEARPIASAEGELDTTDMSEYTID